MNNSDGVPVADLRQRTQGAITMALVSGLTEGQDAVLALLLEHWQPGVRLSQRDIVKSAPWLGCHPEHEADVVANEFETTTRMVREQIRDLRLRGVPVLSDRAGYYLPSDMSEATEYVQRTSATARARAKASMVTYHTMRRSLGVSDPFLDSLKEAPAAPVADTAERLKFWVIQLLSELPENRDWLNPDIERELSAMVGFNGGAK